MSKKRTGSYTLSSKPCDIEYRLTKASELVERLEATFRSIDPSSLSEGSIEALLAAVEATRDRLTSARGSAPTKRVHTRRAGQPTPESVALDTTLDTILVNKGTTQVVFVEEDIAAE